MNPCPCGNYGDPITPCTCSQGAVLRYQRRISGPLMDRIDLFAEVPRVDYDKLTTLAEPEPSSAVRERITRARDIQRARSRADQNQPAGSDPYQRSQDGPALAAPTNAALSPRQVRERCQEKLTPDAASLIKVAMSQLSLSARAFNRVLKVARTVADLSASDPIDTAHVAEAIQYRRRNAQN